MTDPPRRPADMRDNVGEGGDRGSPPGTPRWVKVAVLVALVVALLVVVVSLVGGSRHGPRQHASAVVDAGRAPATITLRLR